MLSYLTIIKYTMTEAEMADILKFASPYELYIVDTNNKLIQLKCPFTVIALTDVGEFISGEVLLVDRIKVTQDLVTVYIIQQKAYFYYHFEIFLNS